MDLQYISDSNGVPKSVVIPIEDWNRLKEKYSDIEKDLYDIPQWQKDELDKRMESYKNNPDQLLDFDQAMDDIEKDL